MNNEPAGNIILDRKERILALRDYQTAGVAFLSENNSALLADEMGLGKTVQVASAIDSLRRAGLVRKTLVVVPTSLRMNWEVELKRWAPHSLNIRVEGTAQKRHELYKAAIPILVATYGQVRSDSEFLKQSVEFDLVVLDEAQNIKNPDSKMSSACVTLKRKYSWALTGTPLENSKSDLFSVFRFVKSGLLSEGITREQVLNAMQPHFLRRYKKDVLPELPPIIEQEVSLEMHGLQLQKYNEVLAQAKNDPGITQQTRKQTSNILALITKLKQICNFDDESDESCKRDALIHSLYDTVSNGKKAIVFSQYTKTLEWLAVQIQQLGINPKIFDGTKDESTREEIVNNFEHSSDPEILLISIKAGGTGLNLKTADLVVLYDRWWNPQVEAQAINRAHRFGRKGDLQVIKYLVSNSVEDRIAQILKEKQELFREYVDNAESNDVGKFSKQQLLSILGISLN